MDLEKPVHVDPLAVAVAPASANSGSDSKGEEGGSQHDEDDSGDFGDFGEVVMVPVSVEPPPHPAPSVAAVQRENARVGDVEPAVAPPPPPPPPLSPPSEESALRGRQFFRSALDSTSSEDDSEGEGSPSGIMSSAYSDLARRGAEGAENAPLHGSVTSGQGAAVTTPRVPLVRRVQLPPRKPVSATATTATSASSGGVGISFHLPASVAPPLPATSSAPISDGGSSTSQPPNPVDAAGERAVEALLPSASQSQAAAMPAAVTEELRICEKLAQAAAAAAEAHARLLAMGAPLSSVTIANAQTGPAANAGDDTHVGRWRGGAAALRPELLAHLDARREEVQRVVQRGAAAQMVDSTFVEHLDVLFAGELSEGEADTTAAAASSECKDSAGDGSANTPRKRNDGDDDDDNDDDDDDDDEPVIVSSAADSAVSHVLSALGFHPLRNREMLDAAMPLWAAVRLPSPSSSTATSFPSTPLAARGVEAQQRRETSTADDRRRASDLSASRADQSFTSGSLSYATLRALYPPQAATATAERGTGLLSHSSLLSWQGKRIRTDGGESATAGSTAEEGRQWITPQDVLLLLLERQRLRAMEQSGSCEAMGSESLAAVLAAAQSSSKD